jgi:signal transduction histidine kinase
VTATAQDEVGTLARSFNEMAAKLDEVEVQRRELVANVSHELRTPIAALRARLENLADGVEALDQDAVGAMLKATSRLSALVDQLLELAQFESGAARLDESRFAVDDLIREAVEEVAPVNPDVRLVVATETDLKVNGDHARLHEVLTNLLTNAVRHSPAHGRVEVSVSVRAAGVRIEVADQGPGIPPEELERVFDRFYRVDSARASNAGGAGLGLAIARSIIELHGGSVHATPNQPQGCRMVIDLPG